MAEQMLVSHSGNITAGLPMTIISTLRVAPRRCGWASVVPFRLQFREFPPNRTNIVVTSLGGWWRRYSRPNGSYGWFIMSRVCRSGFGSVFDVLRRSAAVISGTTCWHSIWPGHSHRWQIARNYPKWTNIVVRSFAPQETLLEPPRWLVWTKWYVKSVPKWFLLIIRWFTTVWCSVFDRGSLLGKLESTLTTGKSPEIIQNGQILLCGVLRRRKLC